MITVLRTYRFFPALVSLTLLISVVLPAARHACVLAADLHAGGEAPLPVEGGHSARRTCAGQHGQVPSRLAYAPGPQPCCLPAPGLLVATPALSVETVQKLASVGFAAVLPAPAVVPAALRLDTRAAETKYLTDLPPSRRYVLFASLLR